MVLKAHVLAASDMNTLRYKHKADKDQRTNVPKQDQQNSDPQTPTVSRKGWLIASGDIKIPELKHSKKPCLFFILEGKACKKRGSECVYDHRLYPRGFKR